MNHADNAATDAGDVCGIFQARQLESATLVDINTRKKLEELTALLLLLLAVARAAEQAA